MLNNVILMGRLTAAPELKATVNGTPVMTFQLAVKSKTKDEQGNNKAAFVDCVAWRGEAEFIARNFRKGNLIAIRGELDTRIYQAKSGDTKKITEVVVREVEFTGEKNPEG